MFQEGSDKAEIEGVRSENLTGAYCNSLRMFYEGATDRKGKCLVPPSQRITLAFSISQGQISMGKLWRRASLTFGSEKEQSMQEQIRVRLKELKRQLETGQAELQKVEMQRTYLRETMLRIEGAIHALEELLAERQPTGQNGPASRENQLATNQAEKPNP
jgi:hypothetical protein